MQPRINEPYRHQDVMRVFKGELNQGTLFSWGKKKVIVTDYDLPGGGGGIRKYSLQNIVEVGIQIQLSQLGLPLTIMQLVMNHIGRADEGRLFKYFHGLVENYLGGPASLPEVQDDESKGAKLLKQRAYQFAKQIQEGMGKQELEYHKKMWSSLGRFRWLDEIGYESLFILFHEGKNKVVDRKGQRKSYTFMLMTKEKAIDYLKGLLGTVEQIIIIDIEMIYNKVVERL